MRNNWGGKKERRKERQTRSEKEGNETDTKGGGEKLEKKDVGKEERRKEDGEMWEKEDKDISIYNGMWGNKNTK